MKVKVSQPQQEAWSNWKHADGMKFNVKKKIFKREEIKKKKKKSNVYKCWTSAVLFQSVLVQQNEVRV